MQTAFAQLKDLFIESIIEKESEIALSEQALQEAKSSLSLHENALEDLKAQIRSQALEFEAKEQEAFNSFELQLQFMQENYNKTLINELNEKDSKEKVFWEEFHAIEEKYHDLQGVLESYKVEIEALKYEKCHLIEKIGGINENIPLMEKKIKDYELKQRILISEYNINEKSLLSDINRQKNEIDDLQRKNSENTKKLLGLESRIQLVTLQNIKKRKKILNEREETEKIMRNTKESYENNIKELINRETTLKRAFSNLQKDFNDLQKDFSDLKEENSLLCNKSRKNKGAVIETGLEGELFERISGKFIEKGKFNEIREILDILKEDYKDLYEEEDIRRLVYEIEKDFKKIKKDLDVVLQEKEEYKEKIEEILLKKRAEIERNDGNRKKGFLGIKLPFF